MSALYAQEYFELSTFEHAALFSFHDPLWHALKKIAPYLSCFKLGNIEGIIEPGAFLKNPELISIGKGSVIESGAYIQGPCIIGHDCQVRHGAYLRGNVITGKQCVIGHATEVKNSIFLNQVQAGHFAYIGDSILGNRVNLGAGTKLANYRFDHELVRVLTVNGLLSSGLKKLGAILGDDVQTGCNSVTNPGTLIGPESFIAPCTSVRGIWPKQSRIKQNDQILSSSV